MANIMANRTINIAEEKDYRSALMKIESLMKKREHKLTVKKAEKLKSLSSAVAVYEKGIYTISAPKTLKALIELKLYEQKLSQKELAKLLGIAEAKLSQIMSKKRKADVAFLQALHEKLNMDGNLLLEYA